MREILLEHCEKECSTTGLYAGHDVVKVECEPSGCNNTRCVEDLMRKFIEVTHRVVNHDGRICGE